MLWRNLFVPNKDMALKSPSPKLGLTKTLVLYRIMPRGEG